MRRTGSALLVVGATGLASVSCDNREPPLLITKKR
jgi:hypothetical protein